MENFKTGDTVSLKHDMRVYDMTAGEQGVIVFCYADDLYEVDFFDEKLGSGEGGFWGGHWDASDLLKAVGESPPYIAEHAAKIIRTFS